MTALRKKEPRKKRKKRMSARVVEDEDYLLRHEKVAGIPAARGVDADGMTGPDAGGGADAAVLPAVARLDEVPGISPQSAIALIAGIGLDMSRFPTPESLVSWAGLDG